jgi:hypothetical protein
MVGLTSSATGDDAVPSAASRANTHSRGGRPASAPSHGRAMENASVASTRHSVLTPERGGHACTLPLLPCTAAASGHRLLHHWPGTPRGRLGAPRHQGRLQRLHGRHELGRRDPELRLAPGRYSVESRRRLVSTTAPSAVLRRAGGVGGPELRVRRLPSGVVSVREAGWGE